MAAARRERDAGRRAQIMLEGEQLMLDDAAIAPVYFYASKNLVSPEITGFKNNVVDEHRRRWMCFKDAKPATRG
jgi:oligopeptide transport system substrate-binding protein